MTLYHFPNVPESPGTGGDGGVPKAPSLPSYHMTHRVVAVRSHERRIRRSPAYVAKHEQLSEEVFWLRLERDLVAVVEAQCEWLRRKAVA